MHDVALIQLQECRLALIKYLEDLLVARRVALVVAFGFLPQNFGRWQGPTNVTLLFYKCMFSGGDTQTLPALIQYV